MKRARSALLLGTALAVVSAGCTPRAVPSSMAALPGARPGGRLVVAVPPPSTVDPALVPSTDLAATVVVTTMCDSLLAFSPSTGALRPGLAESWAVTGRGKRISVKLRRNARFSNGRRVSPEDVVRSLSRLARGDTASPNAVLLSNVHGFEAVNSLATPGSGRFARELRGVRVVDDRTVEIRLDRPDAEFPRVLAHPATAPVPRRLADDDGAAFARQPVCAGPYRLAAPWDPGQRELVLVRGPYGGGNAAHTRGGRGWADEIVIRTVDRPQIAGEVEAGRAAVGVVGREHIRDVIARLGAQLVHAPGPAVEYVGLPVQVPPYDRLAVRGALAAALDRSAIAAVARDGAAVPAHGYLPPAAGPAYREGACAVAGASASPDAGALRGAPIRLWFNDEFGRKAMAEQIAHQWRERLGTDVHLAGLPWDEYEKRLRDGFDGPFLHAWSPPVAAPGRYIGAMFDSARIGSDNPTRWHDDDFSRVLRDEARTAAGESEQVSAFRTLEDIACKDLPAIPIAVSVRAAVVAPDRVVPALRTVLDRSTALPLLRDLAVRGA